MLPKHVIDRELLYINRALFHDLTVQGASVSKMAVK
ncbi:RAxF-45 family protein [Halobacillus sp. Marseille-P3879]|nr:RAxF-45 family protein [Halobacillus sp. Marseille-P3879]